jgi:hypothetical protein
LAPSFSATRVLLILASPGDVEAHALAAAWSSYQAAVVTWSDLSRAGWCYTSHCADAAAWNIGGSASCCVGGRVVPASDIEAVLTRAATVDPADLVEIAEHDREYVAAEMHAFLVAWLTALGGRVVNRPTPRSLRGPHWPAEVWVHLAASISIPTRPTHRHLDPLRESVAHRAPDPASPRCGDSAGDRLPTAAHGMDAHAVADRLAAQNCSTLTVVGERAFGDGHVNLKHHALALAHAAAADLLSVTFDGRDASARLVSADPKPALADDEVVDAVRLYLCARR